MAKAAIINSNKQVLSKFRVTAKQKILFIETLALLQIVKKVFVTPLPSIRRKVTWFVPDYFIFQERGRLRELGEFWTFDLQSFTDLHIVDPYASKLAKDTVR